MAMALFGESKTFMLASSRLAKTFMLAMFNACLGCLPRKRRNGFKPN